MIREPGMRVGPEKTFAVLPILLAALLAWLPVVLLVWWLFG